MSTDDQAYHDRLLGFRRELAHQLAQVEERIKELQEQAVGTRKILSSIDAIVGSGLERPKGADAVARVAREAIAEGRRKGKDGALTVRQIVMALDERGWLPDSNNPEAAVRTAIRRLRQRDGGWVLLNGRLYYEPNATEVGR